MIDPALRAVLAEADRLAHVADRVRNLHALGIAGFLVRLVRLRRPASRFAVHCLLALGIAKATTSESRLPAWRRSWGISKPRFDWVSTSSIIRRASPRSEHAVSPAPGAQYFWWDRVFTYTADPSDFAYQYFHQSRPGALDTSLLSTDYIANPRTMNAVYNFGARLRNALRLGGEKLTGGERNNKQLNEYVPAGTPLTKYYSPPGQVWTPRILKDGSDSAGALGSLNRVYVNIGLFSEEWLEHFNPIVGGRPIIGHHHRDRAEEFVLLARQ